MGWFSFSRKNILKADFLLTLLKKISQDANTLKCFNMQYSERVRKILASSNEKKNTVHFSTKSGKVRFHAFLCEKTRTASPHIILHISVPNLIPYNMILL